MTKEDVIFITKGLAKYLAAKNESNCSPESIEEIEEWADSAFKHGFWLMMDYFEDTPHPYLEKNIKELVDESELTSHFTESFINFFKEKYNKW